MTILVDRQITDAVLFGNIKVEPFDPRRVQPASIDVHLDTTLALFDEGARDVRIDPEKGIPAHLIYTAPYTRQNPYYLHPGKFVLGSTVERIGIPADIVGRIEGRSTLARIGLSVHITAGFIDPGFGGEEGANLTFEIKNDGPFPIGLYGGLRIAQISFERTDCPAAVPYGPERGSKYQGQRGVTPARAETTLGEGA